MGKLLRPLIIRYLSLFTDCFEKQLKIRVFPVSDAEAFGKVQILKMNKTLLAMTKCRSTLVITSNGVSLGSILKHYLELIFEV